MTNFIITAPDELQQIIKEAVKEAVRGLIPEEQEKSNKVPENLGINEAKAFLQEKGFNVPLSTIYKATHEKALPYKYFGRRVIFAAPDLLEWANSKVKLPYNAEARANEILEKSAARKK